MLISTQIEDPATMRAHTWSTGEQTQRQISIVVVDDQRLFRESIAGMLAAEPSISVVGVAGNGLEAVEVVRQFRPTLALVDVKMPQKDGIQAARLIKAELPETKVILLTTFTTETYGL